MKDMYGASMTTSEKREVERQMGKDEAERANREMRDMSGSSITRKEMKAMKRESRKGKR